MPIKIISPTRVEVDGTDAGLLVDFILANPAKRNEIANELADWHSSHVKEDQRREREHKKALDGIKEQSDEIDKAGEFRAKGLSEAIEKAVQDFLGKSDAKSALRAKRKAELEAELAGL